MRARIAISALSVGLALSGCSGHADVAAADVAAAAPSPSAVGNHAAVCEALTILDFRTRFDSAVPEVGAYQEALQDPRMPAGRKAAARRAYFAFVERNLRQLAATAEEAPMRAAVERFADGWADAAGDPDVEGMSFEVGDRSGIEAQCGVPRIIGVPTPFEER